MTHPSSYHGQPSPPHSNQDYPLSDYGHSQMPDHLVQRPYTPPTSYSAQQYVSSYSDPVENQMQYTPEYEEMPALYRQATYRTPPKPITNEGMQTRSGRSLGTPMPVSSPSSRMSQSPRPRKKKGKDRGLVYKIDAPLSEMTKDYDVPAEDMNVWVNRPNEDRYAEVDGKQKGKIPRPMNSFMLYRRAYKERIKKWGAQGDNNQLISSVAGLSWNLEPDDIKAEYARLAIIERDNHAKAFPLYKFAPNKNTKKRERDDEDDTDGEWEGGSSYSSKRRRGRNDRDVTRSRSSTPAQAIYGIPQYHPSSYQASNPHLLSLVAQYDHWPNVTAQYGQGYQYEQQFAYHPQSHAIQYAPTSVPAQYNQYESQLVGLPPTIDGIMENEIVARPEFGIDPSLGDFAPTASYQYGGAFSEDIGHVVLSVQQMYSDEEAGVHPGLQTLAPAEPMGFPATHGNAGSAFDAEFSRFHQEP